MGGKIVVLGKRKLLWTVLILVGVMGPLFAASYRLPVLGTAGQAGKMLTYGPDREGIKFDYPQDWTLRTERYYPGDSNKGDIIASVSFMSPDQTAHGFAQVMQLGRPVAEYIRAAREHMAPGYDSLHFGETNTGGKPGYIFTYKRGTGGARTVAEEYFYQAGEKVYRFSCFYPEISAEQYTKYFDHMLASFCFPQQKKSG